MAFINTLSEEELLNETIPFVESNTTDNDRFPEKRFYTETPADDIAGIPAFNPNGNNNKKVISKAVYTGKARYNSAGKFISNAEGVVFPYRSTHNGYNIVGRNIDGVIFTEYSTYKKWNDKERSFQNQPTGGFRAAFSNESDKIIEGLLNGTTAYMDENGHGHLLDGINKGISIMFVNWNGVIIDRGDFNTGRDKIVSDSAEFLTIINNLTDVVYNNLVLLRNQKITNSKLGKGDSNYDNSVTISTTQQLLDTINRLCDKVQNNIVSIQGETINNGKLLKNIPAGTNNHLTLTSENATHNLLEAIRNVVSKVQSNIVNLEGESIPNGNLVKTGTKDITIGTVNDILTAVKNVVTKVQNNIVNIQGTTITDGRLLKTVPANETNNLSLSTDKATENIIVALQNVVTKVQNNIVKFSKTITNGQLGTTSSNNLTLTELNDIYGLLQSIVTLVQSNIVNENYNINTVETGAGNTSWGHHVKRTFVRKVDIGQSANNVFAIPVVPGAGRTEKIEEYECWDILYVNTSNGEIDITIENNADSTKNDNIPSGMKLKVPDGEVIELSIPKGGYAELNYLRIGNDIYVRGA